MMQDSVILATGGTGGHVFPAIALAEELEKRNIKPIFATDIRGKKYIGDKYETHILSSASPSGPIHKKIIAVLTLSKGFLQSRKLISRSKAKAVIGFGGYPSFAPTLAAKTMAKKIVLHEQNSVLGKVNRTLLKKADIIATSFPETKFLTSGVFVGNPIRGSIRQTDYPDIDDKIKILIIGGSQGALLFTKHFPKTFASIANKIEVTHQVPEDLIEDAQNQYNQMNITAEIKPFFTDIFDKIAQSHLVICRSGSSTISELAVVGRPALFIPLAISADSHQLINSQAIEKINGGWIIQENELDSDNLSQLVENLVNNPNQLTDAANNIQNFGNHNAAKDLADIIEDMIR